MFYHCHTFYVLFRFFYYIYCSMKPRIYVSYQFNNQRNQIPQRQIGIQFLWEGKIMKKAFADETWQEEVRKTWNSTKLNIFKFFDPFEWNWDIGFAIFFLLLTIFWNYTNCIFKWSWKLNDHFSNLIWLFIPKNNQICWLHFLFLRYYLKLILIDILIKEKWL